MSNAKVSFKERLVNAVRQALDIGPVWVMDAKAINTGKPIDGGPWTKEKQREAVRQWKVRQRLKRSKTYLDSSSIRHPRVKLIFNN